MTNDFNFFMGLILAMLGSVMGFLLAMLGDESMKKGALVGISVEILAGIITLCICFVMV